MLNWRLMSRWQNWIIVFLMFSIASIGIHILSEYMENK